MFGLWRSLVARLHGVQKAVGSNPASPTSLLFEIGTRFLVLSKFMKTVISLVLCLCLWSSPVFAATCYTPQQFRAEQAVRFHTRLMVLGLYCQKALKHNTYASYQAFTQRNQRVIREQENRMIAFYRQAKIRNPERHLHSFRTNLANEISMQAGRSPDTFCKRYAQAYQAAKGMVPQDFKAWIDQINLKQMVATSRPACVAMQSD